MALTYGGGAILSSVEAVAVFASVNTINTAWNWHSGAATDSLPRQEICLLDGFLAHIVDSAYLDKLAAEYSLRDGAPAIYRGSFRGSFFQTLPGTAAIDVADDSAIRAMLEGAIASFQLPTPGPYTVYFVFTQVPVNWQGKLVGKVAGGYHDRFQAASGATIVYSVVPFPTGSSQENFTIYVSHELVEAITDPDPGKGWVDRGSGKEIADLCPYPGAFDGYQVSGFWWPNNNTCGIPVGNNQPQVSTSLQIYPKKGTSCFGDAVEGQPLVLGARAKRRGVPVSIIKYLWSVPSGQVASGVVGPLYTIQAPSPPAPIIVQLDGWDELGCSASATRTFNTVPVTEAIEAEAVCAFIAKIRQEAIVVFHPDPLWDPLRDFAIHPVTAREIASIGQFGERLVRLAQMVARASENLQDKERAGSTPTRLT